MGVPVAEGGDPSRPDRVRRLRRAATVVLAAGVVVFLARGADSPADPVLAPSRGAAPAPGAAAAAPALDGCQEGGDRREPLAGFGEVAFRAVPPGGPAVDGCALLADAPDTRAQGLMAQEDLRGYDAMVFRFDEPSTGAFYMFRTVLPLSIAYVGSGGDVVSTTDMDPCPDDEASACPTYPADGPYLHAVEVAQGDLDEIGIVPGATVTFAPA